MSGLPLADELLLHLATPDRRTAAQHCAALIGNGMTLEHLVDHGLAPAMTQVGALWQSAVWSVVDEHIATAVTEAALSAAAAESPAPRTRGDLVIACVEGDWHSLAPRMIAEVLETHGWSVRFMGASQPTSLLIEHLTRYRPHAVLLSCALPMALPALFAAVQQIHELELPVYVGGRALGHNPTRTRALGADGWAADAAGAAELLTRPAPSTRTHPRIGLLEAYRASEPLMPEWATAAMDTLADLMPFVRTLSPAVHARTWQDLQHLLDTASIAIMLDDPTLMDEQCQWLAQVLTARGVPAHAVANGLTALLKSEPAGEHASRIGAELRRAAHSLTHASAPT